MDPARPLGLCVREPVELQGFLRWFWLVCGSRAGEIVSRPRPSQQPPFRDKPEEFPGMPADNNLFCQAVGSISCNESLFSACSCLFFFFSLPLTWHDALSWYRRLEIFSPNMPQIWPGQRFKPVQAPLSLGAFRSGLTRALCTQQDNTHSVSRSTQSPNPSLK